MAIVIVLKVRQYLFPYLLTSTPWKGFVYSSRFATPSVQSILA